MSIVFELATVIVYSVASSVKNYYSGLSV